VSGSDVIECVLAPGLTPTPGWRGRPLIAHPITVAAHHAPTANG
jgi:hypothetical protein